MYFPGAKKGSSITGDFVDGKIIFETENGTYTLSKEWVSDKKRGSDSRCILSTPDGVIREQSKIDAVLKEALLYGEGVYSDILFSSQRNTDVSLQTILDASRKSDAKQEITDAVSQAFAETDGISVDAIEQAIAAKIDEIAGKHWDFDREAPVRSKAVRWSNALGDILKAYYALEDAEAVLSEISSLEAKADCAADDYAIQDNIVREAEEAHTRFNTFAGQLAVQSERRKNVERIEKEYVKITDVLEEWLRLADRLEKARTLQIEKTSRATRDQYEKAKDINDEITELNNRTANVACPTDDEVTQVKSAQRSLAALENKLCGMNITAAVHSLNGNRVEITSLRTGEAVDISGGFAAITEAVKITVPGVLEMQLSPADVDVASVERQIAEQKKLLIDVYKKYRVGSLEELESLKQTISDNRRELDTANKDLNVILGAISFEELETAALAVTGTIRAKETIESDIFALCGGSDIATFITKNETLIGSYSDDYGSIADLQTKAFDLDKELKQARESMTVTEDIPAEYLAISDPAAYLEELKDDLKFKQQCRENALTAKTAAASKLESYKESISGDPVEEVENAKRIFDETKSLLAHWTHIAEVFQAQKANIHANPMQDIADRFAHYLNVISDGKVESNFPEADKLNMKIYSDNNLLDYGKLSEGTKETVSLAFRLAVLDHLFPNGGGVIVLDDPFTDMDAERTKQSCQLIQECAKRHQVIFLTCREEYADMLGGNKIRM